MTLLKSTSLLSLLVGALALLSAGCGGSDSATGSAGQLSKADFNRKATEICEQSESAYTHKVRHYFRQHPEALHIQPEIARDRLLMAFARPLLRQRVRELNALEGPGPDENHLKKLISAIIAGIDTSEEDPRARIRGTYYRANLLAEKYELNDCGPF